MDDTINTLMIIYVALMVIIAMAGFVHLQQRKKNKTNASNLPSQ